MKIMILLFVLACTPKSDEGFKSEAQEYIKPFKVELMSALTTGIKEKGPLEAMHSCNVLAPEIQKKFEMEHLSIGRTSHKIRNPKNEPAEWLKPLLEDYKNSNAKNPIEGKVVKGTGYMAYVEPIYVQQICLTCHGKDIPDGLREGILSKYPGDQAIGFTEGEFRGLFWVRKEI
jgi:hypothetical protein